MRISDWSSDVCSSDLTEDGGIILDFEGDEPVEVLLERAGTMPLPPYIASKRAADGRDREDYQTMFAQREGAVAAPTAALHFTPDLISRLTEAGIATETLTLHEIGRASGREGVGQDV